MAKDSSWEWRSRICCSANWKEPHAYKIWFKSHFPFWKSKGAPKNTVRIALNSNPEAIIHFSLWFEVTSYDFEMAKGNKWELNNFSQEMLNYIMILSKSI